MHQWLKCRTSKWQAIIDLEEIEATDPVGCQPGYVILTLASKGSAALMQSMPFLGEKPG